jgi:hypothetical protein
MPSSLTPHDRLHQSAAQWTSVSEAAWADFRGVFAERSVAAGRRMAEQIVVEKELRERAFLELDATERYRERQPTCEGL